MRHVAPGDIDWFPFMGKGILMSNPLYLPGYLDSIAFQFEIYPEAFGEGSFCKASCLRDEILHCVQDKFCHDSLNRDRIYLIFIRNQES